MAARQDQTLVIALIVFVCIAVLGLAWGYLMFKSSSDAHKQLAAVQQELTSARGAVRTKLIIRDGGLIWKSRFAMNGYTHARMQQHVNMQLGEN